MKKPDPKLRTQPWKIDAVFAPLERILHRIEVDGIVDVAGDKIVFREDGRGGWYDLVAALGGIIEFHQLAGTRHGLTVDLEPMKKLGAKLHYGTPLAMSDIEAVRTCIHHCKRAAQQLRVSEACDIVNTVRISMELEKLKIKEAA